MAKPSTLPRWANLADPGDIVDPPSGKKDSGWLVGEKPPHTYFNWYMNLVYQWAAYLDGLTGEALTWTAAHIFSAAATFNNGIIVNKGGASYAVAASGQSYFAGGTNEYALTGLGNGTASGAVFVAGATGPAAVLGTAGSTGANTQAGVRGVGVLAAPGVEGVGTATVGGIGVKGTSSATNTAGVLGESAGAGRGVEGVADAAGGIGVYGHSVATDGVGGYFIAPGTGYAVRANGPVRVDAGNLDVTAGNAVVSGTLTAVSGLTTTTLAASDITASAAITAGANLVSGANVTLPNTGELAYQSAREEYMSIPVTDFVTPGSSTYLSADPYAFYWGSLNSGAYTIVAMCRPPAGSVITQFSVMARSTDSVTRSVIYRIFKVTNSAANISTVFLNPSAPVSDGFALTAGWDAWAALGPVSWSTPDNNLAASGYGGVVGIALDIPQTTVSGDVKILGVRFKYAITNNRRGA